MEERSEENLEEVEKTLELIKAEKRNAVPESKWKRVLHRVFFPFIKLFKLIKSSFKRIRIPITAKTTIIYTLLFAVTLTLLGVFVVSSVENHMAEHGTVDEKYVRELRLTMSLVILLSIGVIAALGSIASSAMLAPVRKMINRIDDIGPDDLSKRIDDVDSQDELKLLTERINAMLDELEQSFEQQKKFVSDASHELKTPIAVIQGYSNLLLRWGKNDPSVLDESVESIAREADNMKRIVEQLLTLAKMGRLTLNPQATELCAVLSGIADDYAIAVKTHRIVFAGVKSAMTVIDRELFVESVRALVDNAVKYSPENSVIRIYCDVTASHVVVRVVDNGIGISAEDLPHVFDRFYRCDRSRSRDGSSSGLGLTIAKSIIEAMGGTIEAKSVKGEGSTFTIRLPIKGGEKQ